MISEYYSYFFKDLISICKCSSSIDVLSFRFYRYWNVILVFTSEQKIMRVARRESLSASLVIRRVRLKIRTYNTRYSWMKLVRKEIIEYPSDGWRWWIESAISESFFHVRTSSGISHGMKTRESATYQNRRRSRQRLMIMYKRNLHFIMCLWIINYLIVTSSRYSKIIKSSREMSSDSRKSCISKVKLPAIVVISTRVRYRYWGGARHFKRLAICSMKSWSCQIYGKYEKRI